MPAESLAFCRALGAEEGQEELLLPLLQAALEELSGRLRPGVSPRDCGSALPLAAAMVAMDRLAGLEGGGGEVTAFTAGDLSVRRESTGGGLTRQAQALLRPWLAPGDFAFRGVRG